MVRAYYVAGRPDEVAGQILELAGQILELAGQAEALGYDEIAFAKLGPDYRKAIELLGGEVMGRLRA